MSVLLSSCTPAWLKEFGPVADPPAAYTAHYFSDRNMDYVYKANVTVYDKAFGGILIAKKINDSTTRVVFTTEFGNKLFDFELTDHHFKVNFVLDELDRKILINTLRRDFSLLFRHSFKVDKQFEDPVFSLYQSKEKGRVNYIFEDKKQKLPLKFIQAKGRKEKFTVDFSPLKKTLAEKIIIMHQRIKLKIELHILPE